MNQGTKGMENDNERTQRIKVKIKEDIESLKKVYGGLDTRIQELSEAENNSLVKTYSGIGEEIRWVEADIELFCEKQNSQTANYALFSP